MQHIDLQAAWKGLGSLTRNIKWGSFTCRVAHVFFLNFLICFCFEFFCKCDWISKLRCRRCVCIEDSFPILEAHSVVPVQNVSIIATLNDASPVSVIAGTPQSFSCATGANPNPAAYFQWYKGNKNITAAGVGGLKQIIFDKTDDGVELVCKGWNDATDTPFPSSVLSINVMCKCYKLFKELAFCFVHGEGIGVWDKQIACSPKRNSASLISFALAPLSCAKREQTKNSLWK